jgi:lysine 2,3-aminomutase
MLEKILQRLRSIPHIEIIRLGTKMPCVLPQRITPKLVDMLKKYHPIYVNTHFNHPWEITEESTRACAMLSDAGCPVGNQMVLMKDVNDDPAVVKELMQKLLKIRVRPYYIYMADETKGANHFRTTVNKGLEIIENLRGWTSGLAVPHFVIDTPGGGGKIPLLPNYLVHHDDEKVVLRNYEGKIYTYRNISDKKIKAMTEMKRKRMERKRELARKLLEVKVTRKPRRIVTAPAVEQSAKPVETE